MVVGATLRQFRGKLEQVLRVHRTMDADAFEDFFQSMSHMISSFEATCGDIQTEIEGMDITR